MHHITLDTNTWTYLANGTEPVRLLKYIGNDVDKSNITILILEIVVNECEVGWVGNVASKGIEKGVELQVPILIETISKYI